ncbi:cadherin-related family member 1-like isoform X2 [Haliotis asinina]|uniref:cadherin-related family member 1-like isoform X2 n=1 Tax=Haliotis asinina TaxID=109174 RepID=UPI0035324150
MFHIIVFFILVIGGLFDRGCCNTPPSFKTGSSVLVKPENTPVGSVLLILTAADSDGPSDLVFAVGDTATGDLVKLGHGVRKSNDEWAVDVVLKTELDRDFHSSVRHLTFDVTDGIYKVQMRCNLIITDINDETPLFLNLPGNITLSETTVVGKVIYQVNATDADVGIGGMITYSLQLSDGTTSPFHMAAQTGEITLGDKLDFEQRTSYSCNITATDGGGLTSTSTLDVAVTDAQDTPPVFERPSYTVHIAENAHVGSSVMTVRATDGDTTLQNKVVLGLEAGPCSSIFKLNDDTGEITLISSPDREDDVFKDNNGACVLNVTATEDSGDRLQYGLSSAWVMVMVLVTDINDNHPTFNAGKVKAYTARDVPAGAPVVFAQPQCLTVLDDDRGPNGIMEIYLRSIGNKHDTVFQVSPQRAYSQAQIFLNVINASALQAYPYDLMTVELYAKETSSPSHIAMVTVSIDVQNTQSQCNHVPIVG